MIRFLLRCFSSIFGNFSWKPPTWASKIPPRYLAAALVAFSIAWTAKQAYLHWQKKQPHPIKISVRVVAPNVAPLQENPTPDCLMIRFGASVAKLDTPYNTPITSGITLSPNREGVWSWSSDTSLVFHPKADWPAGQKYQVKLSPTLFPKNTLLDHSVVDFTTPPFVASIPKIEFYTDPTDPTIKQVVTTLSFTHPVELDTLKKFLNIQMIGDSPVFKKGAPQFTVTLGLNQRLAYLRTSPLILPEHEDFLKVTLAKGLTPINSTSLTTSDLSQKIVIPDINSFFKITSTETHLIRNPNGDPEQILIVATTGAAKSEDIQKALRIFHLPKNDDEPWKSPQEIDEEILKKSLLLATTVVPSNRENSNLHTFRITLPAGGQVYLAIAKGLKAFGGFTLGADYATLVTIPELPKEIEIQGDGGILAISGERKLSVRSRGIHEIHYQIGRVPANQINHLVSQTSGEFQNPAFRSSLFTQENIARIATERQTIQFKDKFKPNFSTFDFTKHLAAKSPDGSAMHGLFFLEASEYLPKKGKKTAPSPDEPAEETAEEKNQQPDNYEPNDYLDESGSDDERRSDEPSTATTQRFILITDLGMIVKENAEESQDVFISSIKTGLPLAGVTIEILGKNGVPLVSALTQTDGRVHFPSLGRPTNEKKPVAFVARLGTDLAFMPYARADRLLNFSRFNIGGVESRSNSELDAFVFTERGIYRPGDEIHVGILIKQRDWAGKLDGLPIETEVTDAKGTSVQIRKLALPSMGFADLSYQTTYQSPSGDYTISAYLIRNGKRDVLLGDTTVIVKDFLPDRMKIVSTLTQNGATISTQPKSGWITPQDVHADISLQNLYATPATNRRIKAHFNVSAATFHFDEFKDFQFFDRLSDPKKESLNQEIDLGELKTNDQGITSFALNLERFANANFHLHFFAEGFEADGGRSVSSHQSLLVSPMPYLIGSKPDANLDYLKVGSVHSLEWIAVDPPLKKIAVENLQCRLIEITYVSVLSKSDNGNYVYESVLREKPLRTEPLTITADGLKYPLPTDLPGNYSLELFEKDDGPRVSKVTFSVVGNGAISRSLDKNAELQIKLANTSFTPGEDVEISVVAPYTGSGLITIERDKVYAHAWFKTDRTSSTQRIRIPADFEGTGYINVCFVRALDSKEVFMSPLSYAAVPFKANLEKRRLPITLLTPKKSLPGQPLHISYKTDRPARIVIFAVDQGILQVSNYELPKPLDHFFRQAALMVKTKQIVDLILPEFSILRSASAFGGDGEKTLNPFKRITEKPVVFWSGIVDSGPRPQEVIYNVPDYFSGSLTVMAVAISPDATAATENTTLIRGPFVLSPNVPTTIAPDDSFDVSLTIANGVEGSGKDAPVQITVTPSDQLEIIGESTKPLTISEGQEVSASFKAKARQKLGSASLTFQASTGTEKSSLRSTISVRPATPFMTDIRSGNFTKDSTEVSINRPLYPDFRKLEASISGTPLGLARGLDLYLKNYPNGCSEQITSAAFSRLLLSTETDFGLTKREISQQLENTFAILRTRQNDDGSFGYWATSKSIPIDFLSVYITHFLIEAKAAGFTPPANLLKSAITHLQAIVAAEPQNLPDARTQAYATYLLTREGVITTNYLLNIRDYLEKNSAKTWRSDLTTAYLAASYSLLKKQDEASRLIKTYKLRAQDPRQSSDFYSPLGADAQYIAILAKHFPDLLKRLTGEEFKAITQPIGEGQFNTLSAAYAVFALKSYSHQLASANLSLSITEIQADKKASPLSLNGESLFKYGKFSPTTSTLRFTSKNQPPGIGTFYQVIEAGYDQSTPSKPLADGLEIFREFINAKAEIVSIAKIGDPITVRIRIRALGATGLSNVAIVDLLPGGFEFVTSSISPGLGSLGFDYVEVREDRAVFFGSISTKVREFTYQIKPTNRGSFTIPPAFAESMYDRSIKARSLGGKITVTDAP